MRRILAGLVGLGLAAGAGSVVYHNHGATVKIKGSNGQVQNVHIAFKGQQMSCPSGEGDKVNPLVIELGRIKLTLKGVETDLRRFAAKYPSRKRLAHAPRQAVVRFKDELTRGKRLESAYNAITHRYNATLDADCKPG